MPSAFFNLRYLPLTGSVPGQIFTAPGRVVAVAYNGIWMAPQKLYDASGGVVTLKIPILEEGDRLYALCVV